MNTSLIDDTGRFRTCMIHCIWDELWLRPFWHYIAPRSLLWDHQLLCIDSEWTSAHTLFTRLLFTAPSFTRRPNHKYYEHYITLLYVQDWIATHKECTAHPSETLFLWYCCCCYFFLALVRSLLFIVHKHQSGRKWGKKSAQRTTIHINYHIEMLWTRHLQQKPTHSINLCGFVFHTDHRTRNNRIINWNRANFFCVDFELHYKIYFHVEILISTGIRHRKSETIENLNNWSWITVSINLNSL